LLKIDKVPSRLYSGEDAQYYSLYANLQDIDQTLETCPTNAAGERVWDSVEVKDALTAKIALVNGSLAVLHTTDLPDQLDIKDLQLHSIVKKHLAHREL